MKTNLEVYNSHRHNLKTLDILLFSGRGFTSNTIKFVTKSLWSHIAIVYKIPEEDIILCFESTTLNQGVKGVQVTELSRKIINYKGKVFYRSFSRYIAEEERKIFIKFRKEIIGLPYENSYLDLFLASFGASRNSETSKTSWFCSEVVASLFHKMNILNERTLRPADSYAPHHFSSSHILPLKNPYDSYGKEIPLN